MNHQKDDGQVGKTISHYPAYRDPVQRDIILEKLGEGGMSSLFKKYNRLIPQSGSSLPKNYNRLIPCNGTSLITKYNKLIPLMGSVVYKAYDLKHKRFVALKFFKNLKIIHNKNLDNSVKGFLYDNFNSYPPGCSYSSSNSYFFSNSRC